MRNKLFTQRVVNISNEFLERIVEANLITMFNQCVEWKGAEGFQVEHS